MKVRVGASTVIAAVAASFLMVFVVPVGVAAAASPDLTPGPSYTVWAYGALRTVDFSGESARGGWGYEGSATYGYTVILNQTNLTSQTFELSASRTMGANLSVKYCTPSCKSPTATASVTYRAWEDLNAWANFTTAGTVYENGMPAAAVAINNSHTTVSGNLTDLVAGVERSGYLAADVSASASVQFAHPLGLLPDSLSSGLTWNSSSPFTASGQYALTYYYHLHGPAGNSSFGPYTSSDSIARTGNVSVLGSVRPGNVNLGNQAYQNVSLAVVGPFDVREGFLFVPSQVDLFGESPPAADEQSGAASVQMTSIDVRPGGPHLGIGGSEWMYSASALNPSAVVLAPDNPGGVTELASGADNVSSTAVQGVPIPVAQAQSYNNCLTSGSNCPQNSPRGPLGLLVGLGALVVVVAVLALAVLVVQRRRVPPPTYPNALLYPPGGASPAPVRPPRAGESPPAEPPAEDDPLSNLW
jgi:hypothetical protein